MLSKERAGCLVDIAGGVAEIHRGLFLLLNGVTTEQRDVINKVIDRYTAVEKDTIGDLTEIFREGG